MPQRRQKRAVDFTGLCPRPDFPLSRQVLPVPVVRGNLAAGPAQVEIWVAARELRPRYVPPRYRARFPIPGRDASVTSSPAAASTSAALVMARRTSGWIPSAK